jgi:pimeloyl-ACP methyl ester carboxylesterase
MTDRPRRIVFFPGLGADARLLEAQRSIRAATIDVVSWIDPLDRDESLSSYARRFAETLPGDEAIFLGGVSFGGPVALEVARHIGARASGIVLLSSFRSLDGIPLAGRMLGRAARRMPLLAIGAIKRTGGFARSLFGAVNAEQARLFDQMRADASPRFMKWSACALMRWTPPTPNELKLPILHIHGSRDRVIPLRRVRPDHVIDGAGHLMNVTHAAEVNRLIDAWIESIG